MAHVDVVRNDHRAGVQSLVARVHSLSPNAGIKVETEDAHLAQLLASPLRDPATGREVSPDDGDDYLDLLARKWDGTYVIATPLHRDADCPFGIARELPLVDLTQHQAAASAG